MNQNRLQTLQYNHLAVTLFSLIGLSLIVNPTPVRADSIAPSSPTTTVAYQSGQPYGLIVQWKSPGDDGVTGMLLAGSEFRIQWATGSPSDVVWSTANAQVIIATQSVNPGMTVSATINNLPQQQDIFFRVWARDDNDNYSAPSATASAYSSPFSFEIVDGQNIIVGENSSLAIDQFGNLHLVYPDRTNAKIRYLKRKGTDWEAPQIIDSYSRYIEEVSAAVDNFGKLHVSYRGPNGQPKETGRISDCQTQEPCLNG